MSRSRKGKKSLIDWMGRTSSFATLQEADDLLDQLEDTADELEARQAHLDEVGRCFDEFERYSYGHPKYMEALQRLTYLQSPQHAASRTFELEMKKAGRRAKHGFIVALMPLLNILLILGCNAVAIMLLVWLVSVI